MSKLSLITKTVGSGLVLAAALIGAQSAVAANITIPKKGPHCVDDPNCHNRWHHDIKPVATAKPGDVITYGTRDAFDDGLTRQSSSKDIAGLNLNLVHPITGPVFIDGAEAGDVLAVELIDVNPDPFGYTIIVPGFGFLRDLFTEPFLVRWDLTRKGATSPDLPGVKVKLDGFLGTVGVAPGPDQEVAWKQREGDLAAAGGVALPAAADASASRRCVR